METPVGTLCMACDDNRCDFKPIKLLRRPVGDFDIFIEVKYCGVCHSDLSTAAGHAEALGRCQYPCVPGHELAGVCTKVGSKVTKIKVGQHVGVGCMVDSCKNCSACSNGEEQNCSKHVMTYNGKDNSSDRAETYPAGGHTLGGYSTNMVINEEFAILIPQDYPLEFAGPVMCSGITMFDPIQRQHLKSGDKIGIVGLGGLGQIGIKISKALGLHVTVISRSAGKEKFAKSCGADNYIVSTSEEAMNANKHVLDLIINTIPVYHDYCAYNVLLGKEGRQVVLGLHVALAASMILNKVTFNRSRVLHSAIGGIKATQKVIDLCAKHKIYPEIKIVPAEELNSIFQQLDGSNDEGVRYVLDIKNSLNGSTGKKCLAKAPPTLGPFFGGMSPIAILKEFVWLLFTGKWL